VQFTLNLSAGVPARQQTRGSYFLILSTGAAASVGLRLLAGTAELESLNSAKRGTKARVASGQFDTVELTSAVDAVVEVVISDGLVDIDLFSDASVNATIVNPLPVPVSNDRGTPGNLLHVAAVTVADAPAVAASSAAPVAVTDAGAALVAADADRRALRVLNQGPDPVAIVPPGGTWAQRVIVLEVDDVWVEDRAANLAWAAITDAAKAASVSVQEVTA